jgi:WD40 repeat protein
VLLVLAVCLLLGAAATGITILATRDDAKPTTAQALLTTPPTLVAQLPADPDRARAVYGIGFSADGRRLAVADGGTTVGYPGQAALRQYDVRGSATPAEIGRSTIARPDWWGIAFTPDLRTAAVGISDVVLLDVHDPARTSAVSQPFSQHSGTGHRTLFAPDGRVLAIATPDGAVRLWNVADRAAPKAAGAPFGGGAQVLSLAFSPDGHTLAVAGSDSLVHLWNVADRAHPTAIGQPLTGHVSGVWSVAFSPDGKTLATAGGDRTIRLWDLADPARPRPLGGPLTGHADGVLAVGFSPDGTVLASHGPDNIIHLWNVADPAHAAPLGQPLADQWGATFSPNGDLLATVGIDNSIRLWRLR